MLMHETTGKTGLIGTLKGFGSEALKKCFGNTPPQHTTQTQGSADAKPAKETKPDASKDDDERWLPFD